MKTVMLICLALFGSSFSFGQTQEKASVDSINQIISLDSILIESPAASHQSHVYPSPFEDKLTIDFPEELCGEMEVNFRVYELFPGRIVFESKFKNKLEIETAGWNKGLFAVLIGHYRGDGKRGDSP